MSRIINVAILILIGLFFLSCINNSGEGLTEGLTAPDYTDPDPILSEEIPTTPKSPSSLFVAANIDGEIRGFYADAPADYTILVSDASMDEYFNEFKLSNDKKHLLYVNSERDLILFNIIQNNVVKVLQVDISCNETQFIDNDRIQFSHSSNIYCYTISTQHQYLMIDDPVLYCNHGAVVSPDGSRIIFKNQDPLQSSYAVYAWADVTGSTVDTCTYLGDYYGDIDLLELFEFVWINNDTIFMKPSSGLENRLKAYTIGESIPKSAAVQVDGSMVQFTKLTISNNFSKLIVYGSFGLYQVDLTSLVFDSSIELNEIYTSEVVTTKFAAYSVNSDYLVAATSGCIGVYQSGSLRQTDFDSTKIISEGETIYYLDCK